MGTERPDNIHQLHPHPAAEIAELYAAPNQLVDVETIAGRLLILRDLGRAIAARSTVLLIPDPQLVLAGQRVEHIADAIFRQVFETELPQ